MGKKKVVSHAAVIKRLQRRLAHDEEKLVKNRRGPDGNLGWWFTVDLRGDFVIQHDVDPEGLARELGVLKPYEAVEGA